MILLIGVILISIFFLVVLFLSSKTWKIMHIFAMFLVYGASIAFLVFATISLRTNDAWKAKVKEMRATLEEQQKIKRELEVGKLDTLATADDSQLVLPQQLWRTTYDQGQILRECTPGNFAGNVTVTTVAASDAPVAADDGTALPPAPNGLSPPMIVHAFKEADSPDGKIPQQYIGEFVVTAATDTSATLTPTLKLDAYQQSLASTQDGSTWALYARLPRDNHYAFVDPDAANPVESAKEAVLAAEQELAEANRKKALGEENAGVAAAQQKLKNAKDALEALRAKALPLFGQPLSSEQLAGIMPSPALLKRLLPRAAFPPDPEMTDAQYNDLINKIHQHYLQRYLFDGRPVADIAAADADFAVEDNVYQKIKFVLDDAKKVHEVQVDATGDPLPADEDPKGQLYDSLGMAKPSRLRQGSPTRYTNVYDIAKRFSDPNLGPTALDDIAIYDLDTAEQLVGDGTAEKLDDQFYVRPLRDYEYLFHEYQRRDNLLSERAADITAATTQVADSTRLAQGQVDVRREQKGKLESDEANFQTDLQTIAEERKELEAARAAQMNNLRSLYQGINEKVATLLSLQRQLADEVQKRAAMVSTSGGGGE
ncbi:MAG: hypothetical protein RIC55_35615 [Pirellulaceae bacterium]